MKRLIIIFLVFIRFLFFLILIIIFNNNSYEDKMIKNVSIKCNIEDIKYINKYNDYYIVIDDNSLYLIDSNYKIISEMDKNLLYENTKNYDIIYRNGKLLYSDDIYKDGNLIYRYYDIYSYEMIDEILIGGNYMYDKLMCLIKDRPLVISRILLKNYRKMNINDTELIVIMVLMSFGDKIIYNPEEFAILVNWDKHEMMKVINDLITKNIISLDVERINKKAYEYISLNLLYEKIFNIVIDNKKNNNIQIDISIFDTFEKELGRTLSPMEYEQIKEWITNGNSEEMITCALREAVLNGVSNFRYIDSILNDWRKKGYKNKNDVSKDRENYRNKKEKVSIYDTDWLNDK